MAKSKKNRQQDFQKVKLKVGKKLKKADNVTNASFKTRAIQISQQLKAGDSSQPTTKKKQNIKDLLGQCRHYSATGRVEAVNGLKELITANPDIVPSHLSDILERIAEFLTDKEASARQGALRVFKVLLPLVTEKQISPFFPLFCAHLCCAMTHIYDQIQMDSLSVLDLLLENYPRLMIYKSNQVLSNFIEQISRQQGQGQSKRSLSTNPSSATSSVKWRNSVLNRLQKFLSAILKFHGTSTGDMIACKGKEAPATKCESDFSPDEVTHVQPFPSYFRDQWVMPGFTVSSSKAQEVDSTGDILSDKFTDFYNTLVPLLIECWIESAPSKDTSKPSGADNSLSGDNVGMMYNVLQVTQLLLECSSVLLLDEDSTRENPEQLTKDFEQHFMAGFPYSVNTRISKKEKKQQHDNVQVSAEALNLTVCVIMTHFIGGISTNHNRSHDHHSQSNDPPWLPLITKFLINFLQGKYGKANVGQNARTVVSILDRLISRETVAGSVEAIVGEMYTRFQAAGIASSEKKIYMQFFAEKLLADRTHFISQQLREEFLQSLPELLPLCAKENNQMAPLVIQTMKKGACQKCAEFLEGKCFSKVCKQWYDPQEGVITSLSTGDQRNLIGLLYSLPDLGLELPRILVSLARCLDLSDSMVAFMVQVLQNRFHRSEMSSSKVTVHIGLLVNLLLGVTQADIDSLASNESSDHCPVLASISIVKDPVLDGESIAAFERQCFLVEVISGIVQQFDNTDQVVEVMLEFIQKTLKGLPKIPLQLAFGVCKFSESLTNIPVGFVSLLNSLCISLVSHLITWQHSTNQNAVQLMLDLGCSLLMKTVNGVEGLISMATECFRKELSTEGLVVMLKTVMLFLTENRQQCIKTRLECVQQIETFQTQLLTYVTENKAMVTMETEKLISNLRYLVSCVK